MRRSATVLALCGLAALGLGALAGAAPIGTVTEFTTGLNAGSSPAALTAGPDGNVWFADQGATKAIGRITPSGVITEFSLAATSKPADIEQGSDGNLWFTDQGTPRAIGKITPAGVVTEFNTGLNPGSLPNGLTNGPDGNLYFADRGTTKAIGKITTAGAITETALPTTSSPRGIVAGPDGNLWFTDAGTPRQIGRMTTGGTITYFSAGLNSGSSPRAIETGPDGNLWFNDQGTTKAIGRITTGGAISEFSAGLNPASSPADLAPGPDGNVWFNDKSGTTAAIGRITPDGTITESSDGLPAGSSPRGLALGPDNNLWFGNDGTTKAIGRFVVDQTAPTLTLPATVVTNATGPSGATVSYTVTAQDDVDPNPVVSCAPASGGVFPIGMTTVDCTATDAAGNSSSGSFLVDVLGAADQLQNLLTSVTGVGPGSSLAAKINSIQAEVAANDNEDACIDLASFVSEVNAQTAKKIAASTAASLIAEATNIEAVLAC